MHFISEKRFNPNLQCDDKYYRIKESFRDLTGCVRCRIMLNAGFMPPRIRPEDVRDIAKCHLYVRAQRWAKHFWRQPLKPSLRDIHKVAPSLYELKGYNYLCVSRSRLTDYEIADDMRTVTVQDSKKQSISLREVKREDGGDYYLKINSPGKAMKEYRLKTKGQSCFLDRNCKTNFHTESRHHRGHECPRRESANAFVQWTDKCGGRHIRQVGLQENAF